MKKETLEIYVYIHVKDGKVIYCGKGIKKVYNCGKLYDRAYDGKGRKYNVKEVEVKKIRYFNNEQEALYFEERLTDYLKSIGQCEYNIDSGNKFGEEHRQKLSENHADMSGENNPMYGRIGEQAPCYGRTGEKHPLFGRTGEQAPCYGRTGEKHPNSRAVIAFTDSGSYYKEFVGMREAERELGIKSGNIGKCCKGERKSAGEYKGEKLHWRYKE